MCLFECYLKECLTATDEAKRYRCLYQFQTKNVDPIQVYTRPRGVMQGGKRFCYNQQSSSLFEFVGVLNSNPTNSISSNNMFAISDDVTSQQYGVVCFGQDVAASADTVAVMVSQKSCWTNIANIFSSVAFYGINE